MNKAIENRKAQKAYFIELFSDKSKDEAIAYIKTNKSYVSLSKALIAAFIETYAKDDKWAKDTFLPAVISKKASGEKAYNQTKAKELFMDHFKISFDKVEDYDEFDFLAADSKPAKAAKADK